MALRHDTSMDSSFLAADPPPVPGLDYHQPRTDLASEYFNTFNQVCENYRSDTELNLRQTSDSLRLSSEILDGVRPEYVSLDFNNKLFDADKFVIGRDEHSFRFDQPDASALLRHRARRRLNDEHGIPNPVATSQESGVSKYKHAYLH